MDEKPDHLELARIALRKHLVRLGYSQPMASELVNGRRKPTLKVAANIERELGISASIWETRPPLAEMWEHIVRDAK